MKKRKKKDLTGILSQTEIVTLAVFLLGGDRHVVDTEDAAVKAHELAPGRFSWRKYPDQINLELVRVYLSDGKKAEKGRLLTGSGRTGWVLTKTGLHWAQKIEARVSGRDLGRRRADSRAGSIDETRWRRERARILSTAAWDRWSQDRSQLTPKDAAEVFRIDSYAVGSLRQTKMTRLLSLFQDDQQLLPFLEQAASVVETSGDEE